MKNNEDFQRRTIALNDLELSTELASIQIQDIVVPEGATPLLQRRMRCRIMECLPGEHIATHSHVNRPAILYVLEGQGEEHSNQFEGVKYWKEGDCFTEYNNVEHWVKNRSEKRPLRIITFDLFDDAEATKNSKKKDCGGGC